MTSGVDPGYDIGLFKSGQDIELYTTMVLRDNGINYTRQALPVAGADTVVLPLGVDYKKGGEVIFSATTLPVGNHRFWLEDRVSGVFTDLSTKSYTVTIPPDTYGTGRFYIIASTNTPTAVQQPTREEDNMRIWVSGSSLIIRGTVSGRALCEVFDISGQKILEKHLEDGEFNTVDIPAGLIGVLVVRVTDGPDVTTRKVAVHN